MYEKLPKITYIFRFTQNIDLEKADKKLLPKDYFYFYHYVGKSLALNSISILSNRVNFFLNLINNYFIQLFLGFDFPLLNLLIQIPKMGHRSILFATTPKIGIGLAFLKRIGVVKNPVVMNIVGLYDQLKNTSKRNLAYGLISSLISDISYYVSGASIHEGKIFSRFFHESSNKVTYLPYLGVDCDYFSISKVYKNFILCVGVDPARDWRLYSQTASYFPNEKFIWATNPKNISASIPSNVSIKFFEEKQLRILLRTTKLVLVLTQLNHHFSGAGTLMRAMSCAKPVIVTKTPGCEEYGFQHMRHCVFVSPGNLKQVISSIKLLKSKKLLALQIGTQAAKLIRNKYSYEEIGKEYVKFFNNIT